ncbi:transposase family protein, partial [Galbitalea sp. SE-J8]|uniref:transposase family protein n=1 Tax=Galbitalea sp. SE-J8 TaxID=3054952 RepID=UPI00259D143A
GKVGVSEDFADQGRQGRLVLGHRGISSLLLAGNNWSSHGGPSNVNDDEDPAGSDTTLWDSPQVPGFGRSMKRARSGRSPSTPPLPQPRGATHGPDVLVGVGRMRRDSTSVQGIARHLGVSWKTV